MTTPPVAIIMGSQSDWATMRHTAETLEALGVPFEARIISAHRTPKRMMTYAAGAKDRGLQVIIAGAGGAAHLPGKACPVWEEFSLGLKLQAVFIADQDDRAFLDRCCHACLRGPPKRPGQNEVD